MNLRNKKSLVARILKAGKQRVWFNPAKLSDIKEAITKDDLKSLMQEGSITVKQKTGSSRSRARKKLLQKRKGRQKGIGSRKGKVTARSPRKREWIVKIRSQRNLIKELIDKEVISKSTYQELRKKSKGGFFRNKRHVKLYLTEHKLWIEKNGKK